jgi:hypothetical protein
VRYIFCRRTPYCDKHGTPESLKEHGRIVAEAAVLDGADFRHSVAAPEITVVELAAAYLDFAEGCYRKNAIPTPSFVLGAFGSPSLDRRDSTAVGLLLQKEALER